MTTKEQFKVSENGNKLSLRERAEQGKKDAKEKFISFKDKLSYGSFCIYIEKAQAPLIQRIEQLEKEIKKLKAVITKMSEDTYKTPSCVFYEY